MERINIIKISSNAEEMGRIAAFDVSEAVKKYINKKGKVNMVFAAAPSQDTFLTSLSAMDIDWSRITCFHLDEYVHQQYDDYKNDPDKNKRYSSLDEVPRKAITLTIPTILAANEIYVIVPGSQKADAVKKMWEGPITEKCPSSALRLHAFVKIYLEKDSASHLKKI